LKRAFLILAGLQARELSLDLGLDVAIIRVLIFLFSLQFTRGLNGLR
jgi:hypothetical protein